MGIFVGSKQLLIKDEENALSYPVLIHYPTYTPSKVIKFGPFNMDVSPNADTANGQFPLILISHGNGGSPFVYRTISTYLAKKGFIVAMIEHYGNNRNNNDLERSEKNLYYRPRHISITIDYLLADKTFGQHILEDKIGIIGHSFGGYTAVAIAGGQVFVKKGKPVATPNDFRIKALVLMAPAAGYFLALSALSEVTIPILLLIAEHDQITPEKWTSDVILNGVPDKSKVICRTIENAGHFSFISPFPTVMKNSNFIPSTDPEGFDREAFHRQLPGEIFNFLDDKLN